MPLVIQDRYTPLDRLLDMVEVIVSVQILFLNMLYSNPDFYLPLTISVIVIQIAHKERLFMVR